MRTLEICKQCDFWMTSINTGDNRVWILILIALNQLFSISSDETSDSSSDSKELKDSFSLSLEESSSLSDSDSDSVSYSKSSMLTSSMRFRARNSPSLLTFMRTPPAMCDFGPYFWKLQRPYKITYSEYELRRRLVQLN